MEINNQFQTRLPKGAVDFWVLRSGEKGDAYDK